MLPMFPTSSHSMASSVPQTPGFRPLQAQAGLLSEWRAAGEPRLEACLREVSLESASQGQPPQVTNPGFPTSELRIRSSPWRWPALIPVGVMSLCLQKTSAGRFSVGHLCGPPQVELLPFLLYCNEIRLSRSREPVSLGFICWAKGTSLI